MVLDRDAEFGNLMQHRELIHPRNHCAHWEDAWLVSIAWRAIVAHRAAAQCGAHFLALSLLDDDVYADDRLLETFDAPCQELLDLCVFGQQLALSRVLDALKEDVHIKFVLLRLSQNIPHKRNHRRLLALDLQLQVGLLLVVQLP